MKTETVQDFLKRGGSIKKFSPASPEKTLTADCMEKAQPSFFEQSTDEAISEAFGLPLDSEVDSDSVDASIRRLLSKRTSVNHR